MRGFIDCCSLRKGDANAPTVSICLPHPEAKKGWPRALQPCSRSNWSRRLVTARDCRGSNSRSERSCCLWLDRPNRRTSVTRPPRSGFKNAYRARLIAATTLMCLGYRCGCKDLRGRQLVPEPAAGEREISFKCRGGRGVRGRCLGTGEELSAHGERRHWSSPLNHSYRFDRPIREVGLIGPALFLAQARGRACSTACTRRYSSRCNHIHYTRAPSSSSTHWVSLAGSS